MCFWVWCFTIATETLKQKVNIYIDSLDTFAMAHVHGQIYKQRGLLISRKGKPSKINKRLFSFWKLTGYQDYGVCYPWENTIDSIHL